MGALTERVSATFDGMPVTVNHVSVTSEGYRDGQVVTIEGFLGNELHYHKRNAEQWMMNQTRYGSGSGIGVSADQFINTPIGGGWGYSRSDPISDIQKYTERMLGREVNMREGTQGSYAYGVAQLAEGLSKAVESGWITKHEAEVEFRRNVDTVREADDRKKYEAARVKQLEEELAELREKQAAESS